MEKFSYDRSEEIDMEDGVDGSKHDEALELGGGTAPNGDDDLLRRLDSMVGGPRTGELLRSAVARLSRSRTLVRTGDVGGKASSTGFLGVRIRIRLGEAELEGLAGRSCGG